MNRCRSCGARIVWARHEETGRHMIFDAEPVEVSGLHGLFVMIPSGGELVAGQPVLYRSHFATCPDAAKHRRA